jgi:hypothetical protein
MFGICPGNRRSNRYIISRWSLAPCHWPLSVGLWFLVSGFWPLVAPGCWSLASGGWLTSLDAENLVLNDFCFLALVFCSLDYFI